jgi:hypothetical protein
MGRGLACLVEQSSRLSDGCFRALEAHGFVSEESPGPPPTRPGR